MGVRGQRYGLLSVDCGFMSDKMCGIRMNLYLELLLCISCESVVREGAERVSAEMSTAREFRFSCRGRDSERERSMHSEKYTEVPTDRFFTTLPPDRICIAFVCTVACIRPPVGLYP